VRVAGFGEGWTSADSNFGEASGVPADQVAHPSNSRVDAETILVEIRIDYRSDFMTPPAQQRGRISDEIS